MGKNKAKAKENNGNSPLTNVLIYLLAWAFAIGGIVATFIMVKDRINLAREYRDYQVIEGVVAGRDSIEVGDDDIKYCATYTYEYTDSLGSTYVGAYRSDYVFDSSPKMGSKAKLLMNETGDMEVAFRDCITWKYIPYSGASTLYLFGALMFATVGACFCGTMFMDQKLGFIIMSVSMMVMGVTCSYLAIFEHYYIALFTAIFGWAGFMMFKRYVLLTPEEQKALADKEESTIPIEVVDVIRMEEFCEKLIAFRLPDAVEWDADRLFGYIVDMSEDTGFEIGDFYMLEFHRYKGLTEHVTIEGNTYLNISSIPRSEFKKLSGISQFLTRAAVDNSENLSDED